MRGGEGGGWGRVRRWVESTCGLFFGGRWDGV